ncbi:MAG: phosphatidylserine/phosphatidylglycerophosphate/cardiolipin synthase-like enzyme [Candidatus Azotimanducaceae bacterium]
MKLSNVAGYIFVIAVVSALSGCHNLKALPDGTSFQGEPIPTANVAFVADKTWVDENGEHRVEQAIFNNIFHIIAEAREIILLDMFLYGDFQGPVPETTRLISGELTDALVAKKLNFPKMEIVVITDPVNELYGGLPSPYFKRLKEAGIRVVVTDVRKLRDSNAVYSFFWRILAKPFGNATASTLPNPIGPGRVSIRSYLELINFKANHRKVLVADSGDTYLGFVSSANPHDGSSAHRNVAIRFSGRAVSDLIKTENAVLKFSGHEPVVIRYNPEPVQSSTTIKVITEGKIKDAVLSMLDSAEPGQKIDLMMFYLSDRKVIKALKRAHQRGARLRLLLDPNKAAFGREKNGIPNRPVGYELNAAGIPVRWCSTQGEQCHAKMLLIHKESGESVIITGSANFTRRNLTDFNLETNVMVSGHSKDPVIIGASRYFDDAWNNVDGRVYSLPIEHYKEPSWWRSFLYRFTEVSGISSY